MSRMMMRKNGTKIFFLAILILGSLVGAALGLLSWQSEFLLALFLSSLLLFQAIKARAGKGLFFVWMLAILLGVLIGLYHPKDFQNLVVLKVDSLYAGGNPFEIDLNLAKLLAGYAILFLFTSARERTFALISHPTRIIPLVICLAIGIIWLAVFLLGLNFHIKLLSQVIIFSLFNLFAVCVVEEAFMRLLLQEQIRQFLWVNIQSKFVVETIPLVIATLIFVLTHGVHNLQAIVVFGVAGFCYGAIYSLTRSIWPSVALHFLVNFLHFSLFTYPLA